MTADTTGAPNGLMQATVLVVTQRGWLVSDYGIFDEHQHQLAGVRQGRQGLVKRQLEIIDSAGMAILRLVRPFEAFGWNMMVTRSDGTSVGKFVARPTLGLRLVLESRGRKLGELRAENRSRERFMVTDSDHEVVAHLERQREGLTSFRYTLRIHRPPADPFRSLLVATPFAVDVRLRELKRGAAAG
jgi:hypothetical protein